MLGSSFVGSAVAVAVSGVAAGSDWRSSTIPNWLTLPPIAIAPVTYGLMLGPTHAVQSLFAMLVSGAIPYVLFRQGAMGGGDVKLFAALGALTGFDPFFGMRIQLLSYLLAMLISLVSLASKGALWKSLRLAGTLAARGVSRRPAELEAGNALTAIRMGGAIFVATTLCSLAHLTASSGTP